ncbi:MAG: MoaD/ThiS family protein [Gammaproteobacteria bacterium]|nr:MoaD/ThiS family protein [Gammaproteobacteria bacterium]
MKVRVKFFASMRDSMGRADDTVEFSGKATVADVWAKVSKDPLPENTLIAVNMEYTSVGESLKDGDEVAFFPPVTGG